MGLSDARKANPQIFFRIPFNLRYSVVCETEIPQVAYAPPVKNIPERNIMKGLFHTKGRFFQPFWYPLGLTNPSVVYTTSLKKEPRSLSV